jgi:hypothetical protein
LATNLAQPDDEDDLYLARGEEVEPYRPLMQGDIFKGIALAARPLDKKNAVVSRANVSTNALTPSAAV